MTLTPIRGTDFVSTSLDQTVNVWEGGEGKLRGTLPGPQVGYDILTITKICRYLHNTGKI